MAEADRRCAICNRAIKRQAKWLGGFEVGPECYRKHVGLEAVLAKVHVRA